MQDMEQAAPFVGSPPQRAREGVAMDPRCPFPVMVDSYGRVTRPVMGGGLTFPDISCARRLSEDLSKVLAIL